MNIVVLQTFLAIVEAGSLVRASEKLNVTQSTVTARLRTLEDRIGQPLLFRQKSGATLTPAGTKLLRYAEIMVGLWRQARHATGLPEGMESVCNFGCHVDLWPGLGKVFLNLINQQHPKMALAAWQGGHAGLNQRLGAGLLDVVMTYQPVAHGNQKIYALRADEIVLFASEPGRPMRFDPGYVFVDLGENFREQHAAAYSDADTARITFGTALWALEFLLENGGSAYLPKRLAMSHVAQGRLFILPDAPTFQRNTYLVVNDVAATAWKWLPDLTEELSR